MIKLFSGTANIKLAVQVSKVLNIPLSQSEVVRFEDSEVRVRVLEKVKDKTCAIIQPTSNPSDPRIMELLFFCDALKRSEAKKIIAIIPYFGYSRQNIQHREGEAVSAHVIINLLESVGFDEVFTFDIHDEASQGIFSVPFKNLSAMPILAKEIKDYLKTQKIPLSKVTVVSPDQGGVEKARLFGQALFNKMDFHLAVAEKKRDLEHIHQSFALDLFGDVKGKTAILVDDIITSGGTLLNAAHLCFDKGAKRILVAVVHHDFSSQAPSKIQNSDIEKFFTTDTIPLKDYQKFPKMKKISVAPVIADALKPYL